MSKLVRRVCPGRCIFSNAQRPFRGAHFGRAKGAIRCFSGVPQRALGSIYPPDLPVSERGSVKQKRFEFFRKHFEKCSAAEFCIIPTTFIIPGVWITDVRSNLTAL